MKNIIRLGIICLMPVLVAGCVTTQPRTQQENDEQRQQMDELNMFMLSNGHYIPNHE